MKNYLGIIIGFIIGTTGFLLLFKVFVLDRVSPEDEFAPGIVVIAAIFSGLLFAVAVYLLQRKFIKKPKSP